MLPARKLRTRTGGKFFPNPAQARLRVVHMHHSKPEPLGRVRLISTDFDGTIHDEGAPEAVPAALQRRLAELQQGGVVWAINTGRDLCSLLEAMVQAEMFVRPDYVVAVEREIYRWDGEGFRPVEPWNQQCREDHAALYQRTAPGFRVLHKQLRGRFDAHFYQDDWSPLAVVARSNLQMDEIQLVLEDFCRTEGGLSAVRNDVYTRLSHHGYSKGTALREIARLHDLTPAEILAAGDHFNDLPMLDRQHAARLVSPSNAIAEVKAHVQQQGGFIAQGRSGLGILEALSG